MKVDQVHVALRYHVIFNKEESDFLRSVAFLHPASKSETDMWLTHAEIEYMKEMYPSLSEAVDRAVQQASELSDQARKEFYDMMGGML